MTSELAKQLCVGFSLVYCRCRKSWTMAFAGKASSGQGNQTEKQGTAREESHKLPVTDSGIEKGTGR